MGDVIRCICVSLLVVSFVFSGAAWASCIDLHLAHASGTAATAAHDHHTPAVDHSTDDRADSEQVNTADPGPLDDHDHAPSIKCCSAIPAFSLTADIPASPATFSGALISFRTAQRDLIGFVASLDPGIPINIV